MVTFCLLFCWVVFVEEISVVTEVKPSKILYSSSARWALQVSSVLFQFTVTG
jgi:hypothetical protein